MSTGYRCTVSDLAELLHAATPWHRKQIATMLKAVIKKERDGFCYFDESGAEISLSDIHRRSQASAETQRSVYNLWYYYTMWR